MISDTDVLRDVRADWEGVRRIQDRMQSLCVSTFAGGAFTAPALAGILYNLPLLLAFDVLRGVLRQMCKEGAFHCSRSELGRLMDESRAALPWIDWQTIRDGVKRRNEVAHDGRLVNHQECLSDIRAVETQLVAWGIIDSRVPQSEGATESAKSRPA